MASIVSTGTHTATLRDVCMVATWFPARSPFLPPSPPWPLTTPWPAPAPPPPWQVITEGTAPYRCLSVSAGWTKLTGWSRDEALGSPLSILQGKGTEPEALHALMRAVNMQLAVSVRLTNYTKDGVPFVHQLSCEPLRDPSGETRCFQATSLVLSAPGEPVGDTDALVGGAGALPSISNHIVPPLWPLLGRAVSPTEAMPTARAQAMPANGGTSDAARTNLPTAVPTPLPSSLRTSMLSNGLMQAPNYPSMMLAGSKRDREPGSGDGSGSLEDVMGSQRLLEVLLGSPPPGQRPLVRPKLSDVEQEAKQRANQQEIARCADELDSDLLNWLQVDEDDDGSNLAEAIIDVFD